MRKSIIIVMSCGLIALVSASKYLMNKRNNNKNDKSSSNENCSNFKENTVSETNIDLEQQRERAAATIFERHNETAQIIGEILKENNDHEDSSNHKIDFDEIDSSLNKLLDEE